MSELESILNYLETTSMEPHDDYTSEFSYKEQKVLWKYIKQLQQENKKCKEVIDKSIKCIDYNNRYRNDADIYQFVDIKGEILEPLKDILEQNEENSNIYLKEFNDWLKEVE